MIMILSFYRRLAPGDRLPALALGLIGYAALQGIARNPEARGPIFTNMILVAGLAEAIAIYVLIVAIILAMIV